MHMQLHFIKCLCTSCNTTNCKEINHFSMKMLSQVFMSTARVCHTIESKMLIVISGWCASMFCDLTHCKLAMHFMWLVIPRQYHWSRIKPAFVVGQSKLMSVFCKSESSEPQLGIQHTIFHSYEMLVWPAFSLISIIFLVIQFIELTMLYGSLLVTHNSPLIIL